MIGSTSGDDKQMEDLEELPGSRSYVSAHQKVAISADGIWLISFQAPNDEAKLWRLGSRTQEAEIVFKGSATSFAFSRSGKFVAIGLPNNQIKIFYGGNRYSHKETSLAAHQPGPTSFFNFNGSSGAIKKTGVFQQTSDF